MPKKVETSHEERLAKVEAQRKRWATRLTRAVNAIKKLDRQRARLLKPVSPKQIPVTAQWHFDPVEPEAAKPEVVEPNHNPGFPDPSDPSYGPKGDPDDLAIPEFLRRGRAAQKAVDEQVEAVRREVAETKRLKTQGRIAKMKAKRSGATRAMPLSGRAALAKINEA
jgi:hypothetical protein